jgi:hypothetical protein
MTNKILEHYGTKGMKWGIRKDRKSSGKTTKAGVKSLSDAELRTRINRLNMEKQYKTLTTGKTEKSSVSKGVGFVGGILKTAGRKALTSYLRQEILGQLIKARPPTTGT